jgi:hypothetical protein
MPATRLELRAAQTYKPSNEPNFDGPRARASVQGVNLPFLLSDLQQALAVLEAGEPRPLEGFQDIRPKLPARGRFEPTIDETGLYDVRPLVDAIDFVYGSGPDSGSTWYVETFGAGEVFSLQRPVDLETPGAIDLQERPGLTYCVTAESFKLERFEAGGEVRTMPVIIGRVWALCPLFGRLSWVSQTVTCNGCARFPTDSDCALVFQRFQELCNPPGMEPGFAARFVTRLQGEDTFKRLRTQVAELTLAAGR